MGATWLSDNDLLAVFLIGPSGAGKTTLADRLAQHSGWAAFHGGRRLRNWARARNDVDLQLALDHQVPVAGKVFVDLVRHEAAPLRENNVVFDGFPRNMDHQSRVVEVCEALACAGRTRTPVYVLLDLPQDVAHRRRQGRTECPSCGRIGLVTGVCPACGLAGEPRPAVSYDMDSEWSDIAELASALEGEMAHVWKLDSSKSADVTATLLMRLLGLNPSRDADGMANDLWDLISPRTSARVRQEVWLFVDALRLANIRRFFHQRFFEEEGKDAEYADRIESFPKLENVAAHSWHVADGVMLLGPRMPGVDYRHATQLAVIHDKMEMFIGDKDPIGRDGTGRKAHAFNEESKKRKRELEEAAIDSYLQRLPRAARALQAPLLHEALLCETVEARFVKSIDKLAALSYILVKKAGRSTDSHLELLHALTLRNSTFYPPLAEHHREVLRRIVSSVAKVRRTTIKNLCWMVNKGRMSLF